MVMVGGVYVDWLEKGLVKRNPSGRGSSIKFPLTLPPSYALPDKPAMFATNLNNRPVSSLYPKVVGQHPLATYSLTNAVGTISGIDSRTFDRAYNLSGHYPSNRQVCLVFLLME